MSIQQSLIESGRFLVEMVWITWWPIVLGFTISGAVQAFVSQERMGDMIGGDSWREIGLASGFGFISSSCSFGAVATAKSLFKKGASAATSLAAYEFASTNLVIEIGIVIWIVLSPTFMVADFVGGALLIVLLAGAFKYLVPESWIEDAREHVRNLGDDEGGHGMDEDWVQNHSWKEKLLTLQGWRKASKNAIGEWGMLWKELVAGFLIASLIKGFVPESAWQQFFSIFPEGTVGWVVFGVVAGAVIGVLTFVCSVSNVPFALVLWQGGIPFGGVLSYIFADLIVPHIVDMYRKFYGWRMAATMFVLFFVAAAVAGVVIHAVWAGAGLIPARGAVGGTKPGWYTAVLNVVFSVVFLVQAYFMYFEERGGGMADVVPGAD
ncbi:permease [Halococcus morrhuae DSM 1307]|uniref:permease n=1 Tax=Halococcus morrhuae TaxID=2250 RepID=UPI003F86203E